MAAPPLAASPSDCTVGGGKPGSPPNSTPNSGVGRDRGGGGAVGAAVVAGAGQAHVEAVARPEPGPGQVRVRLEGCGVCASNLTPWSGPEWMQFPTEPGALGHEGWGVIDALGEALGVLAIGAGVAALSYKAYAEYDLAEADAVVRLPDSLGGQPFPGEPLGCAMNIFRRGGIAVG